jgi:hypothetical protein
MEIDVALCVSNAETTSGGLKTHNNRQMTSGGTGHRFLWTFDRKLTP